MKKENGEIDNLDEKEVMEMLKETSQLAAKENVKHLSTTAIAAQTSNSLANDVEFWKWMGRNYSGSGIFDNPASMQNFISQGAGKEQWVAKQLQGKGYEWDWMAKQRGNVKNVFNTYDAGDVANRAASDVSEVNVITNKVKEYQMKAYTNKSNPHLTNTPKDMTVVTNAEKVEVVKGNGYKSVQEFQNSEMIKQSTNKRMEQIKSGKSYAAYNLANVTGAMAKAGAIGCAIGIGTETIFSYRAWKKGEITGEQYLKEIMKAGGDGAVTGAATTGLMIPVSAAIAAAGVSSLITIPVAFVVGGLVNNVVAPCFGRGKYKKYLSEAKYYQNLENVYDDLIDSMEHASNQYYNFVNQISIQHENHEKIRQVSKTLDVELKKLYDKI